MSPFELKQVGASLEWEAPPIVREKNARRGVQVDSKERRPEERMLLAALGMMKKNPKKQNHPRRP